MLPESFDVSLIEVYLHSVLEVKFYVMQEIHISLYFQNLLQISYTVLVGGS